MHLEKALDWNKISTELKVQLNNIGYNPDLKKFYSNIENMVSELSKKEVKYKMSKNYLHLEKDIQEINQSIDHLKKLIIIANLIS